MLDTILIFLITTCVIWLWWRSKPFYWQGKGIPYSTPWPIVGSVFGILIKPPPVFWLGKYRQWGRHPIFGIHLFGSPTLLINDPDIAKKTMITDGNHFLSHSFHSSPQDELGDGLFFADGEHWRTIRQKLTPYFTPSRIKGMVGTVESVAGTYADCMASSGASGPVDVTAITHKYTTDLIVATTFGIKPDCLTNPDSFFTRLNKFFTFRFILIILAGSIAPRLYDFFRITLIPADYHEKVKSFLKEVILSRIQGVGVRQDFLQGMVELLEKDRNQEHPTLFNTDGTKVARFNEDGVVSQCMMMYSAGADTTASGLSSLLYELALNQDAQDRVRAEIEEMLQRSNGSITLEHLGSLSYTNNAINEALRMYSVLPVLPRMCTKDYDLDGLKIEKGVTLYYNCCGMQRDPRFFPEPNKFDPDRFGSQDNYNAGSFLAFGLGSRQCIGMKFARVGMLLAVCKLLSQYRLTPSSKTKIPMDFGRSTILLPLNLWLNVQPL